jgi:hypothetical protein
VPFGVIATAIHAIFAALELDQLASGDSPR